jgi:hypothetical protein
MFRFLHKQHYKNDTLTLQLRLSVNVLCTFNFAYSMLSVINELCLCINMQLSLDTVGHRSFQRSYKHLGLIEKTPSRVPRHDRSSLEVISVSHSIPLMSFYWYQLSLDTVGHRSFQKSYKNLGLIEKTHSRVPRHDRSSPEVISVSHSIPLTSFYWYHGE